MRRLLLGLLAALLLTGHAEAYSASAFAVLAADTGALLDGAREDEQLPMASTTKIMTGLLAAEDSDLDRIITVPAECAGVEGSSMYLKAQEQLPLRDVLYGLMLCSGNDAAECIAAVCGGRERFITRMNTRARQLGLTRTHFDNPSGLDGETHYTTAEELARLAAYALQNESFAQVVSTQQYTAETRTMTNHNKLLRLYDDAIGVKTGFTKTAGRCLVSAARRNGRTVVAVTLNDGDDWNDHMKMLDAAFDGMQTQTWAQAGQRAGALSVQSGMEHTVSVAYAEPLEAALLQGESALLELSCATFLYAPVEAGTVCGRASVRCGDTVLCETDLVCTDTVALDAAQEDTGWRERFIQWFDRVRHKNIEE